MEKGYTIAVGFVKKVHNRGFTPTDSISSDILNKQHKRGARLAHREREREKERERKIGREREREREIDR